QVDEGIYEPRGYIFVNGVLVEKVDSLYSYNLIGAKRVLSRDRKSINTDAARKEIAMIIGRCSNEKFITRFLSDYDFYHLEQNLDIHISSAAKPEWKKVMKKKFNKHCLSSGTEY